MHKLWRTNNHFEWNDELQYEFETMKEYVKHTVKLSPFDLLKEIHLHTDASNTGIGFILSQPKEKFDGNSPDHYRTQ